MEDFFYIILDNARYFLNFFGTNKLPRNKMKEFESVDKFIKDCKNINQKTLIILWHLSASSLGNEKEKEIPSKTEDIDTQVSDKILYKIGKSQSNNYLNLAETKCKNWFDLLGKATYIEGYFKDKNWNTSKIIAGFPKIKARKDRQKAFLDILHIFLPLDIYMQALETAEKKDDYLKDMHTDLEKLYDSEKYMDKEKKEHYRQKLYDLWFLLEPSKENERRASPEAKKLTSIDNNPPDNLLKLARLGNGIPEESPIYKFLGVLDTGMDVTAEDLCKPFNLEIEVNGKKEEIKSFHNWYCALASCLRGAEKAVKGSN